MTTNDLGQFGHDFLTLRCRVCGARPQEAGRDDVCPGALVLTAPKVLMKDTLGGLRLTVASESSAAQLVFRTREELFESGLLEQLGQGFAMMVALGMWEAPKSEGKKVNLKVSRITKPPVEIMDARIAAAAGLELLDADRGAGFGLRDLEWVLERSNALDAQRRLLEFSCSERIPIEVSLSVWDPE